MNMKCNTWSILHQAQEVEHIAQKTLHKHINIKRDMWNTLHETQKVKHITQNRSHYTIKRETHLIKYKRWIALQKRQYTKCKTQKILFKT